MHAPEGVEIDQDANCDQETSKSPANTNPKDRKISWARLPRVDSLNFEAGRISSHHTGHGSKVITMIHYQQKTSPSFLGMFLFVLAISRVDYLKVILTETVSKTESMYVPFLKF